MPDRFPESVEIVLAARVGYRCSRPTCAALTSGPETPEGGTVKAGVAVHIQPSLTVEERARESNGIWLCQPCAKLVASDPSRYSSRSLVTWKTTAELDAQIRIGRAAGFEVTPALSALEIELLHAAAGEGDIWVLSTKRAARVQVGAQEFRRGGDPVIEAVCLDALQALAARGLVRQLGITHYKLTGEGFRVAHVLTGAALAGETPEDRPRVTRRRRRRSIGEAWSDKPAKPYLIENISSTGALLQTDHPIEQGEILELDLALDDGSRVRVTAEVVRVQPPDWGQVGGVGIAFKEFHGTSLQALEKWAGADWDPPR